MSLFGEIAEVAARELKIMAKRPIYVAASVITMAFCTFFFLTFLGKGLPEDLPIGVVDLDGSSISRRFARELDASRLGKTVHYPDFVQARNDMQKGRINAFIVLPAGLNEDVMAYRRPVISYYVNSLYFVGGALAYKQALTMATLSSAAVQREVLRAKGMDEDKIMGMLQPIVIDAHQIGNATTSYQTTLCNMLIPGMLQMIAILLTIYCLGTELKYRTSRKLLELSGGSFGAAIIGKLIPLTVLMLMLGWLCDLLLYHWLHFPVAGSIWNIFLGTTMLVLASEALGIFILGCLPVLRDAISVGSLASMLSLSLTGFTLPVEVMPAPFTGLTCVFPLRHYYLFFIQEGIHATGFGGWYVQLLCFMAFLFLPLLVWRRLKNAYIRQDYPQN
ncbi:MAG: ABC transporter permease [Bacteroidales bacterium]|nr:ABC transporter permease [Bacteroidales bacterium]